MWAFVASKGTDPKANVGAKVRESKTLCWIAQEEYATEDREVL